MNGKDLQGLIDAAGESQRSFSKKARTDHTVVSRLISGDKPIPGKLKLEALRILRPLAVSRMQESLEVISNCADTGVELEEALSAK